MKSHFFVTENFFFMSMSQLGPGSRVARTWGKTQSRDTETTRGSIRCGPAKVAVATVDAYLQYHSATGEVQLSQQMQKNHLTNFNIHS